MVFSNEVIQLHDIARMIEHKLGVCDLSKSIRECADKLNEAGKEFK